MDDVRGIDDWLTRVPNDDPAGDEYARQQAEAANEQYAQDLAGQVERGIAGARRVGRSWQWIIMELADGMALDAAIVPSRTELMDDCRDLAQYHGWGRVWRLLARALEAEDV